LFCLAQVAVMLEAVLLLTLAIAVAVLFIFVVGPWLMRLTAVLTRRAAELDARWAAWALDRAGALRPGQLGPPWSPTGTAPSLARAVVLLAASLFILPLHVIVVVLPPLALPWGWFWAKVTLAVAGEARPLGRAGAASAQAQPGPRHVGHGLIGMRERMAAVGGTLSAGPTPEGGFSVQAYLPWPSASDGRPA
jgi:hypothetical protein